MRSVLILESQKATTVNKCQKKYLISFILYAEDFWIAIIGSFQILNGRRLLALEIQTLPN